MSKSKDYVWPYTFPHHLAMKQVQDGVRIPGPNINLYTFRTEEQFKDWIESPVFDPKGYYTINDSEKVLAYEEGALSKGFAIVGTHPTKLFPGDKLFQLKATHGIPLEISLENLTRRSMVVDWVGFINEARLSGWYDFQTLEVIQNALADVFDRDYREAITLRLKRYILSHPLTA